MSEVKFKAGPAWSEDDSKLVYRESEHSFDVLGRAAGGISSLLVEDLNLELDDQGRVLYAWGLCPRTQWVQASLRPPRAERRKLLVTSGAPETPGTSRRLGAGGHWSALVSNDGAWVCIANSPAEEEQEAVEFMPGAIAVLDHLNRLKALWLRLDLV
jgi:hypothetical protein